MTDYQSATNWACQTALRDVIGKTMLSEMLEGRDKISSTLQKIIDERTEPWGITVISIEVKDVLIPLHAEQILHGADVRLDDERTTDLVIDDNPVFAKTFRL